MNNIRVDIGKRLREGRQLARDKYKKEEATKIGTLRAGNSGIMSNEGDIAGSCHRLAHLRSLGIQVQEPDDPTLVMFQLGIISEDAIYNDLILTVSSNEVILREHEIPIEWTTTNNTKVTGRPDLVICEYEMTTAGDKQIIPRLVIEAKSVASVWVSRSVLLEKEPKISNLAQVGHYMWKLGVPGRLMYKQYAIQAVPDMAFRFLPRNSEFIEYDERTGNPRNIKPFEIVYELQYNKQKVLQYRIENTKKWINSVVSIPDIERYYEFISRITETGDLGNRPIAIKPNGKEMGYKPCKYCSLKDICGTKKNVEYTTWLAEVKNNIKVSVESSR